MNDLDTCTFKMPLQGSEIMFTIDNTVRSNELQWPKLSKFRIDFTEPITKKIKSYFPEGNLKLFNVLLPKSLPTNLETVDLYSTTITTLAQRFSFETNEMVKEFKELLTFFISEITGEYCSYKTTEAHVFWPHFLQHQLVPWKPNIKKLITTVLVLPVGTADIERSFSILNHFKYNRRSRLTPDHVEDITRLRFNGPELDKLML
jgi:hypothetical protein